MEVTAAFYPLQWAAERVGGEHVEVTGLTKPGAEPHDLELTPKAVGGLAGADVVVYLAGFQPAVDEAVTTQAADAGFDVTADADLTLAATDDGHDHAGETADEHEEHADEAGAKDPHFWLDPVRFQSVVTALGERFASADPDQRAAYRANAEALVADLRTLDGEFEAGLARCRSDELVTAHAAFALPRRPLRAQPGGHRRPHPRERAGRRDAARARRPRAGARGDDGLQRDPRRPRPRRDPRAARPARPWPSSTPSRGSPTPPPARTTLRSCAAT